MKDVIKFGSNKTITVQGETVNAILIHFKALQADGVTVCNIADLNKIAVEVGVIRKNYRSEIHIFNGYLGDLVALLSAGSTREQIFREKRSQGYLFALGFDGILALNRGDELRISINAQNTAFTSLSTVNSEIEVETIPAIGAPTPLSVADLVPYQVGEVKIDKVLGDNVVKAVLCHDFTTDYDQSAKAKPTNGIHLDSNRFNKDVSENALVLENNLAIQYNPDSVVNHLVVYNDLNNPISNVRLKANLDKGVDADAKIMVLRRAKI